MATVNYAPAAVDAADAYRDTRIRLTGLVLDLPTDALERMVPACPKWRVLDLFAHVTGSAADFLGSHLAGAAGEDWTSAQVESRRGRTARDIANEWEVLSRMLEGRFASMPPMVASVLVADVATHEHDARGAVDMPGAEDAPGVDIGLQLAMERLHRRLSEKGLPALLVEAGNQEWLVGDGEPAVILRADAFELFRALMGRRTDDQITALGWEGDPAPYLGVFSLFSKPAAPLSH